MIIKNNSRFTVDESKQGRFYCLGDDKYPSVTTVISKKKNEGKPVRTTPSMSIGTLVHYHILRRYSRELIPLPRDGIYGVKRDEVIERIRRCLDMWEQLNLNISPICVETALFCHEPRYAGRLDLLCRIDGDLTLIDIKTGVPYDTHIKQAGAYWHALREQPQVAFVYLDSFLDRNPDQKAVLKYFTASELKTGYEEFLNDYIEF